MPVLWMTNSVLIQPRSAAPRVVTASKSTSGTGDTVTSGRGRGPGCGREARASVHQQEVCLPEVQATPGGGT